MCLPRSLQFTSARITTQRKKEKRVSLNTATFKRTCQLIFLTGVCTPCPKKIVPFFNFFFLGAQCVESGVSCTDCY